MRRIILFLLCMYLLTINARTQFCNIGPGSCYQQDSCFTKSQIHTHDYKYATVNNIYKASGVQVDLFMTIYSPCVLPDQLPDQADQVNNFLVCKKCKWPFIMLIHGGGFRTGCRSTTSDECIEFAKRGYVVAAIDYRLGWVPGDDKQPCQNFCFVENCSPILDDGCSAVYKDSLNFAMYRALQDAAAAMRFIVHYAVNLNIDTNFLYIGGYSAGAIISANLCYMNQQELNLAMPGAHIVLGSRDHSGNLFTDSYNIAGLFNNWGCVYDTVYIKGVGDKIPMIAFHGIDDSTVPFAKGFPLDCNNGAYGYYYGSNAMYKRLVNNYPTLPVELYACYGGHGIFNNDPEKDKRSLYRIQKAICFFNRVRSGDKTQTFIQISKNENKIPYQELDLISPVNCSYTLVSGDYVNTSGVKTKMVESTADKRSDTISLVTDRSPRKSSAIGKISWNRQNTMQENIPFASSEIARGLYLAAIRDDKYFRMIKLVKPH